MSENLHHIDITKTTVFGNTRKIGERECGIWQYCTSSEDGVLEQCDGCGEYRLRELEDMDAEIEGK